MASFILRRGVNSNTALLQPAGGGDNSVNPILGGTFSLTPNPILGGVSGLPGTAPIVNAGDGVDLGSPITAASSVTTTAATVGAATSTTLGNLVTDAGNIIADPLDNLGTIALIGLAIWGIHKFMKKR